MLPFSCFQKLLRDGRSCRRFLTDGLFAVAVLILGSAGLDAQDAGKRGVLGNIPAKIDGKWPNDARDTFWYSDYETATRVARASQRPIFLVINRGAPCEV
jgi:hypothetical protein